MATITRYFSTAAAGAGDGTTWANRAQLVSGATWSTVITGFNFASTDSMIAYVGPGTHTFTAAITSGLFANPPTAANALIFHGCDSSGNALSSPDPLWTADRPAFDSSGFPVLSTSSNVSLSAQSFVQWRYFVVNSSGRTSAGGVIGAGGFVGWCVINNSTNDVDTSGILSVLAGANIVINMTGSSYDFGLQVSGNGYFDNVRIVGNAGSSGNRDGAAISGTTSASSLSRIVSLSNGGRGFASTSTSTSQRFTLHKCMAIANSGDGFQFASTASQAAMHVVTDSVATGNAGYGINAQSAANVFLTHSRFRDNTSGNFNGFGNYPTDMGNYTTDSDDATDYRNSAGGDYQIANDSDIVGMGFGISEEPSAGGTLPTVAY